MGQPLPETSNVASAPPPSAGSKNAVCCNGYTPDSSSSIQHLFVYGNSRPDITPPVSGELVQAKRAWLRGGRLYSCNSGGVLRPTLRLEEAGHAVLGYTLSLGNAGDVGRLLDTFERTEYTPSYYDRDVVEVVTEGGECVQSYVYHCQEIDRSNPVRGGDWSRHLQN